MADNNKNKKDKKKFTINKNKFKTQFNDLEAVERETNNRIFGMSNDLLRQNAEDFDNMRDIITKVDQRQTEVTGPDLIEFFTKMIYENDRDKSRKKSNNKQLPDNINSFKKSLEAANNTSMLNNVLYQEKERIKLYQEYELVDYYIPQVHQALDAISDSIISPDDYSKQIFERFYNGEVSSDNNITKLVLENMNTLERTYNIEDKSKKWIHDCITKGDKFIALLNYKDEFSSLLTEDTHLLDESVVLNESNFSISNDEQVLLEELFLLEGEDASKVNWRAELSNVINNNIVFTTNTNTLLENREMVKDFKVTDNSTNDSFEKIKNSVLKGNGVKINKQQKEDHEKSIKELNKVTQASMDGFISKQDKNVELNINGTYIKELEPDKTIKASLQSTCFGYYYFDMDDERIRSLSMASNKSRFSQIQLNRSLDFSQTDEALINPKTKMIVDMFARALSTKLNKKFIEDNKEFKKMIYELVRQDYIMQKKVRVVYLAPDQVEHLMVERAADGYGVSVLSKVLFTCKLYLSVLISTLMMKLSRSVDHRAFYVETGLSKDVENVIQSFIRDIKTKEIKMSDVQTIDTIFKSMGQFSDYFIPTVNGEKPVEFEIISGQDANMDDEFLEYLRKSIISGMGVPSSYMNYHDEIDFSRSIAMQNSRFLRSIVVKQKLLNASFTNIYRKLYINEFGSEIEESNVDVNKIEVKFPSPATLNATNLADQISTSQSIIDFVVQTLVGDNSQDPKEADSVRKVVTKDFIPGIDWERYEKMIEDNKIEMILSKTEENSSEEGSDY